MSAESISRRRFLARAALGLGGASWFATRGRLSLMREAFAAGNYAALPGYRSLVCVFLFGGNDAFNMFVPYDQARYDAYAGVRQGLALPRAQLLPVSGGAWGFHPQASALHALYEEGALGVVANVGSLFEPLTLAGYEQGAPLALVPPDLFSHSHQTELWQTNRPAVPGVLREGWGGLSADLLLAANSDPLVPLSFSTDGENLWQAGVLSGPFGLRAEQGVPVFEAFNGNSWPPQELGRSAAFQAILSQSRTHLLQRQAATTMLEARRQADLLRNALAAAPTLETAFDPGNPLARQLLTVARLIAIRESLGIRRQLFFVGLGGFDTHGGQLPMHAELMVTLGEALASFYRATQELGVADSVTAFSASEFGRTLTSNGDGTDHAWAADSLVLGGAVQGGVVHGTPISFDATPVVGPDGTAAFGPLDTGAGRFIPNWSVDQYGATLARWMGIDDSDLNSVFPNLQRFAERDLGFMLAS